MRSIGVVFGGWLVVVLPLRAQSSDPHAAQPERPTVATHAGTVAAGWLELETGFERDAVGPSASLTIPTVFKIGLARRLQLSLQAPVAAPPDRSLGGGDVAVGVKWRIADRLPFFGDLAVLPSAKWPTGSVAAGRGTSTTDVSLVVISSHALGDLAVDLNAGITHRSGDGRVAPTTAALGTVAVGFPLVHHWGWVAEVFGAPETSGPAGAPASAAILTGPTLTIRSWLVVDAGLVHRLAGAQPNAIYGGAVWNVGRLWRPHGP